MRGIFTPFILMLTLFFSAIFMTLTGFNEIKNKYKEIEPNLDNYAAAELIFLSFERMRTSLFYNDNGQNKIFLIKKQIFDSKIKILEIRSENKDAFFYDKTFIEEMDILKTQSSQLELLYASMASKKISRDELLVFLDEMESTLVDLQEVIYKIQIYHFNRTKGIIQNSANQTEMLAIICLSLLFIIITFLWIHFRKLNKTLKEKNIFISSVYHELSGSIQSIVIASDIIMNDLQKANKETISRITHHANKLLIQTRDILDYSRIEMGSLSVRESAFRINAVLNEAVSCVDSKHNNIFVVRKATTNSKIISDKHKISRIIVNLLDNANKNTVNGKVIIGAKIMKGNLYLSVKDNGCGFDIKKLNFLFKAFNQGAENDTKQGLGLGLTIIKKHVDILKGNLRVKSQEGKGSWFLISIPVVFTDN